MAETTHAPGKQAGPLAGRRVLVTRPERQSEQFIARLSELGAEPVICPTIRLVPPDDFALLDTAIQRLPGYDWVIFTSVNGVQFFFDRLATLGYGTECLGGCRLAAIGPATAAALVERGLSVALVPARYVAEAILDEIGDVAGKRILLPRADIARKALAEGLQARSAQVDEVTTYRTIAAAGALPESPVDIATFTSPSTLRNFVALLEAHDVSPARYLARACIACIGPITAQAAVDEGLPVDVVATEHTVDGLLAALVAYKR